LDETSVAMAVTQTDYDIREGIAIYISTFRLKINATGII
jgi:hypothetical protein